MSQARWAQKPKGFATVKVRQDGKDWWVKPGTAGAPRSTPPGGTPAAQRRNRLPPREYVGSPGLIGSWGRQPRLNPDQYEWTINPETGRWWARPRTELTGLSPQQRADIGQFDRTTEAQRQRITDVYNQYAQAAAADRDAGAAALGKLANLSAAGFTDTVSGPVSGPYGQAPGPSLSQAERALPGVLAQGAREGQAARSAQTIAALNQLPTVARSEGLTAAERFLAERLGQRQEAIGGYREQQAKAAEARAEQAFRNRQLQATLAIAQGGQAVDLEGIRSRERVARQDRLAKMKAERAKLATQLRIARENNLTSRANTLDRLIAQKDQQIAKAQADRAKQRRLKPSDLRALTKRAREMWDGIPRTITDEQGQRRTEYLQYNFAEIVRELQAMGAPRARAMQIARQVTGQQPGPAEQRGVPGFF
jgi:hypothetical protein